MSIKFDLVELINRDLDQNEQYIKVLTLKVKTFEQQAIISVLEEVNTIYRRLVEIYTPALETNIDDINYKARELCDLLYSEFYNIDKLPLLEINNLITSYRNRILTLKKLVVGLIIDTKFACDLMNWFCRLFITSGSYWFTVSESGNEIYIYNELKKINTINTELFQSSLDQTISLIAELCNAINLPIAESFIGDLLINELLQYGYDIDNMQKKEYNPIINLSKTPSK